MPLYEYECKECGQRFDELRKSEDRTKPAPCPRCGGEGRVRVSGFASHSGTSAGDACIPGST
jgi:putative FmdB family regulatory protein